MSWLSAAGKLFRPIGHLGMEIGRGINKKIEKEINKDVPVVMHAGGDISPDVGHGGAVPLGGATHAALPPVTAPAAPAQPPVDAGLATPAGPASQLFRTDGPPPPIDSSMPGSAEYQQYQQNAPTPPSPQPAAPPAQPGPYVPPPPVDASMPGSEEYQQYQANAPTPTPDRPRIVEGQPVTEDAWVSSNDPADQPAGNRLMRNSDDIYKQIDANQQQIDQTGKGQDPGKPREHSFWKRLGQGIVKGYKNWDGQGGVFGLATSALGTGVGSAASPQQHQVTMLKDKQRGLMRDLGVAQNREQYQTKQAEANTRIQNTIDDNNRGWADMTRKENDRISREQTARMKTVAGLFDKLPSYTPGDPKYKEIEEAMGDAKLPLTQKDAKKNVKMIQDQRSGAWTVVLTDPNTGKQEVRPVMKGGKQLATTPTVVMQGENSLARQNDQQEFQAGQKDIDRKESLRRWLANNKMDRVKFEASLKSKGIKGEQAKQMLADYDAINNGQ